MHIPIIFARDKQSLKIDHKKQKLTSSRTLPKSGSTDLKKYLYEPDLSNNILKSCNVISPRLKEKEQM